jgi:hypothetical protein
MPPTYLTIVRRDRPDVLAAVGRLPADDLQVLTDRRHGDRRTRPVSETPWAPAPGRPGFTERRQVERRGPPAATWDTLGFVIARAGAPGDPPAGDSPGDGSVVTSGS